MSSPHRRTVLITGASSGIGEDLARRFAAGGHHLALCARRTGLLHSLSTELRAAAAQPVVTAHYLDVNDHASVFEVFDAARAEHGSLDRVIVNAGIAGGAPVGTGGSTTNLRIAQTNFVAALAQCEAALQIFRAQRAGHLVVMSSAAALRGTPGGMGVYSATKAGLANLAEGIRMDTADEPAIRVTSLFPGPIRTEMTVDGHAAFIADMDRAGPQIFNAINREVVRAFVPAWPWRPIAAVAGALPAALITRMARTR